MSDPVVPPVYCVNHPDRETGLRCHRCDRPICYQCAIKTPVGQICPDCYKAAQAKYYNGTNTDVIVGGAIALVLGGVFGALAFLFLGFLGLFIGILIAVLGGPAAGGAVAEAIRAVLHRRRAQGLKVAGTIAFVIGVLLIGLFLVGPAGMIARWTALVFAGLAASTLYARLL